MSQTLRIAVIEDNLRFRQSLVTLLRHAKGVTLAGDYGDAESALRHAAASGEGAAPPWDLLLMDIELPGISGIEATRRFKQRWSALPVVVLTAFEEPRTILEAICAGADGYLLKRTPAGEIIAQLKGVVAGSAPLSGGVARTVLEMVRAIPPPAAAPAASPARLDLTPREQDVLRALTRGMSYKQVADHLGISVDTVRYFIRQVYSKLQVHSVAEAVGRAIREGIV